MLLVFGDVIQVYSSSWTLEASWAENRSIKILIFQGEACNGKPVLYYHFPSLTRLQYDVVDLVKKLKRRLNNFIGLKYTANDENIYKKLVRIGLWMAQLVIMNILN